MAQWPRWARKQMHEQKLKGVLHNPYADVSHAAAARKAIERKLDQEDREYERWQRQLQDKYLKKL